MIGWLFKNTGLSGKWDSNDSKRKRIFGSWFEGIVNCKILPKISVISISVIEAIDRNSDKVFHRIGSKCCWRTTNFSSSTQREHKRIDCTSDSFFCSKSSIFWFGLLSSSVSPRSEIKETRSYPKLWLLFWVIVIGLVSSKSSSWLYTKMRVSL